METTSRIDSERELQEFLFKLQIADIEIPSNVTLEIDSPIFKSSAVNFLKSWLPGDIASVDRFKYRGQNIMFKSK